MTDKIDKIDTIHHRDKRANIPTNELRGFMEDDERTPRTMLYPHDPSLGPQLMWRDNDEQDRECSQFSGPPITTNFEWSLV